MSDQAIDRIIAANNQELTPIQAGVYFFVALTQVLLPVYLFIFLYDLTFLRFWYGYIVLGFGSSIALVLSYKNIALIEHARLARLARSGKWRKIGGDKVKPAFKTRLETILLKHESMAWTLFYNNLMYCTVFAFLSLYTMSEAASYYNYIVSSIGSVTFVYVTSDFRSVSRMIKFLKDLAKNKKL